MLRWRKRIRRSVYLLVDIVFLIMSYKLSEYIYEKVQDTKLVLTTLERISFVMLFVLFIVLMYSLFNVYEHTIEESGNISLYTLVKMITSLLLTEVFIEAVMFYAKVSISRIFLIEFTICVIIATILNRFFLKWVNFNKKSSDKYQRNILLIGYSNRGKRYIEEIKKHDYLNMNIIGYVSIKDKQEYEGVDTLGDLTELLRISLDYVVDEIAVARPLLYDTRLSDVLNQCQNMGITITMLLETQNKESKAQVAMVGDLPVLKFHTVSLNESQLFAKKCLDITGAMAGMILFGIAYVILAPLIKIESVGPVIFKQDRVGRNGRVFQVWKFRSMGINAEKEKKSLMMNNEMSGHMFKMTNDPRVTKIGAFIRKTSIDELPQFYNVLKGDMSLVGTRPPTVNEVKEYELHHHRRISIMPGITGNWQVSGRSTIEDFEEVVKLDEDYIADWSVLEDLKILIKTVIVVFQRRGSK